MLFHTPTFAVFFILFCTCYFSFGTGHVRVFVLLAFSNIFYGWWDWRYLALLWATILVDYFVARAMGRTDDSRLRKILISFSLLTNLGILGIFKYFNFFVDSVEQLGGVSVSNWYLHELILPVGLSFYTFQSISYTLDVYRRKHEAVKSLLSYATFVCYFPQLVAGPIERAGHLLHQILNPTKPTRERVSDGILLFCLGFFRKSVADTFAIMINPVFQNLSVASPAEVVFGIFGFGVQIYLDFAGYTDMARGISRIMGIDLMINFKTPYLSSSPREFWRRWHISLSQWLRDYLYISLGGNRYGIPRHIRNLMITMLLGGLWHGAGLNFIIWGALHGIYLSINTLIIKENTQTSVVRTTTGTMKSILGWIVTFILVNYAWLYFRCTSFADAMLANRKIISWLTSPHLPKIVPGALILLVMVIAIEFLARIFEHREYRKMYQDSYVSAMAQGIVSGVFLVSGIVLLVGIATQQFIYFQF